MEVTLSKEEAVKAFKDKLWKVLQTYAANEDTIIDLTHREILTLFAVGYDGEYIRRLISDSIAEFIEQL